MKTIKVSNFVIHQLEHMKRCEIDFFKQTDNHEIIKLVKSFNYNDLIMLKLSGYSEKFAYNALIAFALNHQDESLSNEILSEDTGIVSYTPEQVDLICKGLKFFKKISQENMKED